MHRLWRVRARMPGGCHQAGHRARPGKMAGSEYRIRQELAEYYPEEGISAQCEGIRGRGRQVREIFFSRPRVRRLTKIGRNLTLRSSKLPKTVPNPVHH